MGTARGTPDRSPGYIAALWRAQAAAGGGGARPANQGDPPSKWGISRWAPSKVYAILQLQSRTLPRLRGDEHRGQP